MKKIILLPTLLSIALSFSPAASAYTCFFTLVKDSCWTNYNVTVDVSNASTSKTLFSVSVPKGTSWTRKKFSCDAAESFNYSATFSPAFWQTDKGKHFSGKRTWTLPQKMKQGDTAWDITVCYPEEFSEVPFPPTADSKCQCDTTSIPPVIPPKK